MTELLYTLNILYRCSKLEGQSNQTEENQTTVSHTHVNEKQIGSQLLVFDATQISNKHQFRGAFFVEKLTVTQLVTKFLAFCGTQTLFTVFTKDRHWTIS